MLINTVEERRQSAIAYLGTNWICHPQYQPQPRHALSNWQSHSVLASIRDQARAENRIP